MNKEIFNFHFWYGYHKHPQQTFTWPNFFFEVALWAFLGSLLVAGSREVVSFDWQDVGMVLTYVFVCINFPRFLSTNIGFYYGAKALYQFRGYDTISRSPGYRAFKLTPDDRALKQYCAKDIPKDKEVIIASANTDSKGNVWAVLCPGRHHHCIWYMADHGANKDIRQQGFLTNKYRFLGRQDARKLAIQNGQAPNPAHSTDLFSEDLWGTPKYLVQKE